MSHVADMKALRTSMKNATREREALEAECKELDKAMRTKRGQIAKLITVERTLKTSIAKVAREIEKENEL